VDARVPRQEVLDGADDGLRRRRGGRGVEVDVTTWLSGHGDPEVVTHETTAGTARHSPVQ
jgi:hypothetical protein